MSRDASAKDPSTDEHGTEEKRKMVPNASQAGVAGSIAGAPAMARSVSLDCGWGRLLFGQTFDDHATLLEELLRESEGSRNIAFYVTEPHVIQSMAPQQVFLDPSHAFRLDLSTLEAAELPATYRIDLLQTQADAEGINRCYAKAGMVRVPDGFLLERRDDDRFLHLVARDAASSVSLAIDFDLESRLMQMVAGAALHRVADGLVAAFRQRAEERYGPGR